MIVALPAVLGKAVELELEKRIPPFVGDRGAAGGASIVEKDDVEAVVSDGGAPSRAGVRESDSLPLLVIVVLPAVLVSLKKISPACVVDDEPGAGRAAVCESD